MGSKYMLRDVDLLKKLEGKALDRHDFSWQLRCFFRKEQN